MSRPAVLLLVLVPLLHGACAGKTKPRKEAVKAAPVASVKPAAVFDPSTGSVAAVSADTRTPDPGKNIPLIPLETAPSLLNSDKTKVSGSVSVSVGYDQVNSRVDRIGRAPVTP